MTDKELETRFIRLGAYVSALEELLVTLVNTLPNRAEIVKRVQREGAVFDSLAFQEPFSDEELEAFQEARRRVLALVTKPAT